MMLLKLYLLVVITLFGLIKYSVCEYNNILPKYLQAFQFKNSLNGDFGLMLLIKPEYGLMKQDLVDGVPEYCCGNNTRYSNSLLIVNNQYTVSQWFKSSIQDNEKCLNYQMLIPLDSNTNSNGTVTLSVDNFKLINTFNDHGLNNISEYKEYIDSEKYLYCWSLNLTLKKNDAVKEKSLYLSNIGEAWIYINNELKYDFGGIRDSDENTTLELPNSNLDLNIFKCSRSNIITNTKYSISITGFNVKCDLDPICGTCGESYCEAKQCSGISSCNQKKKMCGVCKSVPLNCDDNDPCTSNYCENDHCVNKVINSTCYCSTDNCFSKDLCIQNQCVNKHYCKSTSIVCQGNSTCIEPQCQNGQCICSYHQPITTTLGGSTTSPNNLPSNASIIHSVSIIYLILIIISITI